MKLTLSILARRALHLSALAAFAFTASGVHALDTQQAQPSTSVQAAPDIASKGVDISLSVLTNAKNRKQIAELFNIAAGPDLRAYLKDNPTRRMTFAFDYVDSDEETYCVVKAGLSNESKLMPRQPAMVWFDAFVDSGPQGEKRIESCERFAAMGVISKFILTPLSYLTDNIEYTLESGPPRTAQDANKAKIYYRGTGAEEAGEKFIQEALPGWVSSTFDYRQFAIVYTYKPISMPDKSVMCYASIGISPRPPIGRNPRINSGQYVWMGHIDANSVQGFDLDNECFKPAFKQAIESYFGEGTSQDIERIHIWFNDMLESDLPKPDLKAMNKAVQEWKKADAKHQAKEERELKKKADAAAAEYMRIKKAATSAGAGSGGNCRPNTSNISCQSQCVNGDCTVTYTNGCQIRVQVQPKFNPFNNQWEYPSPGC